MTSKSLAMVVQKKPQLAVSVGTVGDQFFIRLAKELNTNLPAPRLSELYAKLSSWADNLETLKDNAKNRIIDAIKKTGVAVTEKGSLAVTGVPFVARPTRTGYSAKKIEALLRAKGINDLSRWMDAEVSYKLNDQKLGAAIEAKVLSDGELLTCRDGLDENGEQKYSLVAAK